MVVQHTAEGVEVADQVLMEAEVKAEDFVSGVVDDAVEGKCWATVFEPGKGAGVTLSEEAFLGHAGTATTPAGGLVGVRVNEAYASQDPADGARGEVDFMALGEQFGDVLATGSLEGICYQGNHLVSDIFRNGMAWLTPPIFVGQEGVALTFDSFLKAFDLAFADAQEVGGFTDQQFTLDHFLDDMYAS
jgi:hypothetical protein